MYQPFLDGWKFLPDVGNGTLRGEIFTPRFVVDKMLVDAKILPKRAVYDFDYRGSQRTLRKYVGFRVFEPAVGTGNFAATILWHKLEMAHELTGYTGTRRTRYRKDAAQLRRYQAYTLVALGSLYLNDIDPGNLQATKWRLFRDREIASEHNIDYWVAQINALLEESQAESRIRAFVKGSIREASENWGVGDRDAGVLDVLYEVHTGQEAPEWLRSAWKTVLDENVKLFNAIKREDEVARGSFIPGFRRVAWTFWAFENSKIRLRAHRTRVPFMLQVLSAQIDSLILELQQVPMVDGNAPDLFSGEVGKVPDGPEAHSQHKRILEELELRRSLLKDLPPAEPLEPLEMFQTLV